MINAETTKKNKNKTPFWLVKAMRIILAAYLASKVKAPIIVLQAKLLAYA